MKPFVTLCIVLFLMSCTTKHPEAKIANLALKTEQPIMVDHPKLPEHPYDIQFTLETDQNKEHTIHVAMKLYHGSHFVSPHAKRDFKGKFQITLNDTDNLVLGDNFIEIPRSKEMHDPHPFVNGLVNWVSVDTNYQYPVKSLTEDDFTVMGMVQFTIEPNCTLEKIPFVITNRNGELKIRKKTDGC